MTNNYRQFGMEFECFNPGLNYVESGRNIVSAIQGMGYPSVLSFRHSDNQFDKWQIKPDITVARDSHPGKGLEVVAPTLPGTEESLVAVRKVANWLLGNGYDTDVSCGYHVHIDAGNLSSYECAAIALRYHHRQADIEAILPRSRRAADCRWAHSLYGRDLSKVINTVLEGNRRVVWSDHERYVAVNLQHVRKGRADRRIEFRQHSGTLNAAKIVGWYKFICDFVAETLRMVRSNGGSLATATTAATETSTPIIRRQRTRRGETRSVVVGVTNAPRIPRIEVGTDYDLFLRRLAQNGEVTTQDAREFGWMNGGTNNRNSRLRVTAHWLRRHGAELVTTMRNRELAYVGANGARTRQELFTQPAQIRTRVQAAAVAPTVTTPALPVSAARRELVNKLATTPLLSGLSEETINWYNARRADFNRLVTP